MALPTPSISFASAFATESHQPFSLTKPSSLGVLCVHGFPGTPADMRPVAQLLHPLGWDVDAPLLPGFGVEIDALPEKRMEDWLVHLRARYEAIRANHAHVMLLGLSMGGALAVQLAAQLKPDALILLAPFWTIQHPLWLALPYLKYVLPRVKPFKLFKPDFADPGTRTSIGAFLPQADFDDPETQRLILEFAIPLPMIDQVRRAGAQGYAALPQVTCPTLVVQGLQDELVRATLTRRYITRLSTPPQYVEVNGEHVLTDPHAASWPAVSATIAQFATAQVHRLVANS